MNRSHSRTSYKTCTKSHPFYSHTHSLSRSFPSTDVELHNLLLLEPNNLSGLDTPCRDFHKPIPNESVANHCDYHDYCELSWSIMTNYSHYITTHIVDHSQPSTEGPLSPALVPSWVWGTGGLTNSTFHGVPTSCDDPPRLETSPVPSRWKQPLLLVSTQRRLLFLSVKISSTCPVLFYYLSRIQEIPMLLSSKHISTLQVPICFFKWFTTVAHFRD